MAGVCPTTVDLNNDARGTVTRVVQCNGPVEAREGM